MRMLFFSRLYCFLAVALLAGNFARAYPVILKIENNQSNNIILTSESQNKQIKIPPNTTFEIVVFQKSDWRVQYATGVLGRMTHWNMDEPLDVTIDICRHAVFKWGKTVKAFTVELDEFESGFTWTSYFLRVTSTADTEINRQLFNLVMRDYFDISRSLITQLDQGTRQTKFNDKEFNKLVLRFSKKVRGLNNKSKILAQWHRIFGFDQP